MSDKNSNKRENTNIYFVFRLNFNLNNSNRIAKQSSAIEFQENKHQLSIIEIRNKNILVLRERLSFRAGFEVGDVR